MAQSVLRLSSKVNPNFLTIRLKFYRGPVQKFGIYYESDSLVRRFIKLIDLSHEERVFSYTTGKEILFDLNTYAIIIY